MLPVADAVLPAAVDPVLDGLVDPVVLDPVRLDDPLLDSSVPFTSTWLFAYFRRSLSWPTSLYLSAELEVVLVSLGFPAVPVVLEADPPILAFARMNSPPLIEPPLFAAVPVVPVVDEAEPDWRQPVSVIS